MLPLPPLPELLGENGCSTGGLPLLEPFMNMPIV
jgi:hypothetical protein